MKTGIELIKEERQRQIEEEGWDANHDKEHTESELAMVAVCYASPVRVYVEDRRANAVMFVDPFPDTWDREWDKRKFDGNVLIPNGKLPKTKRIRNLVKAGALIAAEIDRLQREQE